MRAREAATEEALGMPAVKNPTSLHIREEKKRAGSEGRSEGMRETVRDGEILLLPLNMQGF